MVRLLTSAFIMLKLWRLFVCIAKFKWQILVADRQWSSDIFCWLQSRYISFTKAPVGVYESAYVNWYKSVFFLWNKIMVSPLYDW